MPMRITISWSRGCSERNGIYDTAITTTEINICTSPRLRCAA